MDQLNSSDALALRMHSLLLDSREKRTPAEVVTWFGAMQAQDLASGEWSFGVRCAGISQTEIHQATLDREIVRSWPMRGTVHFVPPRDLGWMLELTATRALASLPRRLDYLGLTIEDVDRGIEALVTELRGGVSLTRPECLALLEDVGVKKSGAHGYFLLSYASHIGVLCIGPQQGKQQTFVLLDEWVPDPVKYDRDESLRILAIRYFQSHGPARRHDFAGWTGLTLADTDRGVALAGDDLVTVEVAATPMIMSRRLRDDLARTTAKTDELLILPGFDEYLLGYKDRTAMLADEHSERVVPGGNGMFKSTIVDRGRVIGTWSRKMRAKHVDLRAEPFDSMTKKQHRAFRDRGATYATYLDRVATFPE